MSQKEMHDLRQQVKAAIISQNVWLMRKQERAVVQARFNHIENVRLERLQRMIRLAMA